MREKEKWHKWRVLILMASIFSVKWKMSCEKFEKHVGAQVREKEL